MKNYLSKFNVVMLQETWLEKKNERGWMGKLSKGFKWTAKEANRENKRGTAKGGVLIGIKKGIVFKGIEEWRFGLIIKELTVERGKRVNIIVVYNNGRIEELTEELRKILEELAMKGDASIIIRDFSARIKRWQINEEGELIENRRSKDKVVNREGKKLLVFCEEVGGTIKNGNTKGDWLGESYLCRGRRKLSY